MSQLDVERSRLPLASPAQYLDLIKLKSAMAENPNQPRQYDAVLGGDSSPNSNAVVLGGLEAVKRRFAKHSS